MAGWMKRMRAWWWAAAFGLGMVPVCAAQVGAAKVEPIKLHPRNPHYFLFRGKAVALITSGEHYGAVMNSEFDYRKYLATLQAEGMNYTRLFGGAYLEVPGKSFGIARNDLAPEPGKLIAPWARSATPGYAGGGNRFDLEKWDAAYFARYRDFLGEAAKRGVVVEVSLFSSIYAEAQWKMSPLNAANNVNGTDAVDWKMAETLTNGNLLGYQERYVRELVRQANGFDNVLFEIQNEPWSDRGVLANVVNPYLFQGRDTYPNSVDLADELSMAWQARVADWIASEEKSLPYKHMIAQNCCNFLYPVKTLVPGVSIVNFHYAYPEAVTLNYGLDKALAYDETGFLSGGDEVYRRQAWNFMLSGGSTFDGLDYSFNVGHEDGTDTEKNGPGGGSVALRRQLRVLSEFLQALPLVEMKPDAGVVKHAAGTTARVLTSPGHIYAIYLDGSGPGDVTLTLPAGRYSGAWVNVETGATAKEVRFQHAGGEKLLQSPEFANGIALKLTRVKE
jgi:hypothetical protein